jgi:vesicular inhibitory amino acid transporter
MYTDGDEGEAEYERGEIDTSPMTHRSLLREQLARESGAAPEHDEVFDDESPFASGAVSRQLSQNERSPLIRERPTRLRGDSIFQIEPQLASPFGGSYGTTWGSLASRVNEPAMRHAGRLFQQQQLQGVSEPDKEREPLLVKQVKENDGTVLNVVVGQSTLSQTIFNSINVLVGVGLLALPLAMQYAGWILGLIFLSLSAITTSYTAKLLAKCADMDCTIITFADLAYVSFGRRKIVKHIISGLFCIELLGACVALVVLFADSLDALIPGYGLFAWKIFCGAILIPLNFVPFRWLSYSSFLGIICCVSIVAAVIADGIYKPTAPGSLREPAKTYAWPENWAALPIAFGILMSPWGGHGVFPSIYRDMRHPYRYRTGVNITYVFTFFIILVMAVVGLLMFGDDVQDEITKNIVSSKDYPHWISIAVIILIAIIPITKVPLSARYVRR